VSSQRRKRSREQVRTLLVKHWEPPDADPHVRWCERRELVTPSYSIFQGA